jgi:DNA repair exonuclease SbcCD ATPase subunit
MIEINNINVSNFYSIGNVSLESTPGVYLVYGENKDAESFSSDSHVSNGAGKTTLFNALFQGLYNKNLKDVKGKIQSTSNIYTGKPYTISISLTVDNIDYIIENERDKNNINIFREGVPVMIKGVKNQLDYIKNIIGLDFNSFSSLVFLNSSSLENIIDISSKDNIVYQFFNIEKLKELEKSLKEEIKETKSKILTLAVKKDTLLSNVTVLSTHSGEEDTEELQARADELQSAIIALESSPLRAKIDNITRVINKEENTLREIEDKILGKQSELRTLESLVTQLETGTCPLCGSSSFDSVTEMSDKCSNLTEVLKDLESDKTRQKSVVTKLRNELSDATSALASKKTSFIHELNKIKARLDSQEVSRKQLEAIKGSLETLKEDIKKVSMELQEAEEKEFYLKSVLDLIRKGDIVDEYLKRYSKLLQVNINEYSKYSSFNITTVVNLDKGKLSYQFYDTEKFKSFPQLSSGERTRVALIILLATLKSIEQLSGISINMLVLDELLSSLDKNGVEFLKTIINLLRDEKSIFIITHHDEIEREFADKEIYVTKEKNITTMEVVYA